MLTAFARGERNRILRRQVRDAVGTEQNADCVQCR
jgi:hypothetical protein